MQPYLTLPLSSLLLFPLFSLLWSSKQRTDKSRLPVSRRSTFFLCADEAEDDTRILLSAFVIISDAFYMLGDCFPIMIL